MFGWAERPLEPRPASPPPADVCVRHARSTVAGVSTRATAELYFIFKLYRGARARHRTPGAKNDRTVATWGEFVNTLPANFVPLAQAHRVQIDAVPRRLATAEATGSVQQPLVI